MKKSIDVLALFSLWHTDIHNRELARRLGIAVSRLWEIRQRYGLPPRRHERQMPTDDPAPEDIRKRCELIQKGWSKAEKSRRFVGGQSGWTPPDCGSIRSILG